VIDPLIVCVCGSHTWTEPLQTPTKFKPPHGSWCSIPPSLLSHHPKIQPQPPSLHSQEKNPRLEPTRRLSVATPVAVSALVSEKTEPIKLTYLKVPFSFPSLSLSFEFWLSFVEVLVEIRQQLAVGCGRARHPGWPHLGGQSRFRHPLALWCCQEIFEELSGMLNFVVQYLFGFAEFRFWSKIDCCCLFIGAAWGPAGARLLTDNTKSWRSWRLWKPQSERFLACGWYPLQLLNQFWALYTIGSSYLRQKLFSLEDVGLPAAVADGVVEEDDRASWEEDAVEIPLLFLFYFIF